MLKLFISCHYGIAFCLLVFIFNKRFVSGDLIMIFNLFLCIIFCGNVI